MGKKPKEPAMEAPGIYEIFRAHGKTFSPFFFLTAAEDAVGESFNRDEVAKETQVAYLPMKFSCDLWSAPCNYRKPFQGNGFVARSAIQYGLPACHYSFSSSWPERTVLCSLCMRASISLS
jgi:hypothetical protein